MAFVLLTSKTGLSFHGQLDQSGYLYPNGLSLSQYPSSAYTHVTTQLFNVPAQCRFELCYHPALLKCLSYPLVKIK